MTASLTRRRTQLELLADACRQGKDARVSFRTGPNQSENIGRLLALDADAIWLDCAYDSGSTTPSVDADVSFEHLGHRYAFTTRSLGTQRRGSEQSRALKLALPLRIERRDQREAFRVSLAPFDPVEAVISPTRSAQPSFTCRLLNISRGGIAGLAPLAQLQQLEPGQAVWAEFELPGTGRIEFALRRAHYRRISNTSRALVGWGFCPGDDGDNNRRPIELVRNFVARRHRELTQRIVGATVHL